MKRFSGIATLFLLCSLSLHAAAPLKDDPGNLPPEKTVRVFMQKIAYYDVGTGPVLVLVHGFNSSAMMDFGNVILPLSRHHRVLAIDEVGWGTSDKPAIDYSIQTFVDFLGEYLRVMHVQKFDLVGESMGGWIVAQYAIQSLALANTGHDAMPRPSKLILEDAAGYAFTPATGPWHVAGTLADATGVRAIIYDKSRVTPEFIREEWSLKMKFNDGNTQRSLRENPKLGNESVGEKLGGITIPTLVVWGGNDDIVPIADGRNFAAKIPDAKMVVIPECGHVASLEKPSEFVAAVEPFLR